MSKAKKVETEDNDYINVGEYEDVSDLEQALSGLPQEDSIIYLYRMYDRGRPKFLGKLEPGEFDLEGIKDQYGGGRFRYVAKKSGAIYKQGQFEIEGEPRTKHIIDDGANGQTTIGNYDVIKMMQDEIASLKSELIKKTQEKDSTLATLIASLVQKSQTSVEDVEANLLSKLTLYKGLFSGSEKSSVDISTEAIMNAISKGMEIAGLSSGDNSSIWLKVLEGLKEPLTAIAMNASRPVVGTIPKRPISVKPVEVKSMNPLLELIKPYIPMIIISASKNSDPSIYADMVLDHVPDDKHPEIKTWLAGDQWFSDLISVDNRIALQASWWSELRSMILQSMEPEKEEVNLESDNVNT